MLNKESVNEFTVLVKVIFIHYNNLRDDALQVMQGGKNWLGNSKLPNFNSK